MQILRASFRVVAVLAIALLIVLFSAAMLYVMQRTYTGDVRYGARQATGKSHATGVGSGVGAQARTIADDTSQSSSRTLESNRSIPLAEASITTLESPVSRSEASVSFPLSPEQAPSKLAQDATSMVEQELIPGAESGPAATPESPRTPSTSTDAASERSVPDQSVPVSASNRTYRVKDGDTLYGIARRIYGEGRYWRAVYDANRDVMNDARELQLGWTLVLPPRENVVERD